MTAKILPFKTIRDLQIREGDYDSEELRRKVEELTARQRQLIWQRIEAEVTRSLRGES